MVALLTFEQPKLQLPTPPSSQFDQEDSADFDPPIELCQLSLSATANTKFLSSPEELPSILQDYTSLHRAFLRAFGLHRVHNGNSSPADLSSLLGSVTRLWKKNTVTKEDIQRLLAIYELGSCGVPTDHILQHKQGPFTLTLTGTGIPRYSVEYVGGSKTSTGAPAFNEVNLQKSYEVQVDEVFDCQRNNPESWLHKDVRACPRLEFSIGTQTQARKDKASAARKEILGLSSQAQNRPGSQFSMPTNTYSEVNEIQTPQVVKDRTLSLLDRIRSKALANSTATPQTSESILRRRAIGRISEVVEMIRMKQQRKVGSGFNSSIHSSPSKVRGKVSFSLNQLVSDIKGSMAVPMDASEVRKCIDLLAHDVPGVWLSVYTVGSVESVVLNGPGLSGVHVKKILLDDEALR